jgi:hypothetical protein
MQIQTNDRSRDVTTTFLLVHLLATLENRGQQTLRIVLYVTIILFMSFQFQI